MDYSEAFFNKLNRLFVDINKLYIEELGYDLYKSTNTVEYHNFLVDEPIALGNTDVYGDLNNFHVTGSLAITSAQTRQNAEIVMQALISNLGLSKEQAAGICGVLISEAGINPKAYNKGEKNGTYISSGANNMGTPYGTKHCPWSYGAGICQWTFTNRKENALMVGLNISREKAKQVIIKIGIEGLSLEQQISMLIGELQTTYKSTLSGIKKCNTASQAAATYYCHSVAGWNPTSEPATMAEVNAQNAKYESVGAESQISKGMQYAESLLK